MEVQRTGRPGEEAHIAGVLALVAAHDVPVVATNDVRFLGRDEFEAHEARVCIREGQRLDDPGRPRRYSPEQYLKSPAEMAALFADLPEAIAEQRRDRKRCCSLPLAQGGIFMPAFEVPDGSGAPALPAPASAERGARTPDRRGRGGDRRYRARLDQELGVICEHGLRGLLPDRRGLHRVGARARDPGRPGPRLRRRLARRLARSASRTSTRSRARPPVRALPESRARVAAGLRHRLLHVDGRDQRHRLRRRTATAASASLQIVTYGTMAARAVVARRRAALLGLPYGYVDGVAKLIPFELGITLDKTRSTNERRACAALTSAEDEVRELIELAKRLEGLARNAGTHAGGVVIAPSPLTDFTRALLPTRAARASSRSSTRTTLEQVGLVKFDFLGLRTLTIIDRAVAAHQSRNALRRGEAPIDLDAPAARRRGDLRAPEVSAARPRSSSWSRAASRDLVQRAPARPLRRHRRHRRPVPAGAAAVRHGGRVHRPQASAARRGTIDYLHPRPRRDPASRPTA